MNYEVFPFGKYKGVKLKDLPSTYIVLALESFALPEELNKELHLIIYGRLRLFTHNLWAIKNYTKEEFIERMEIKINKYEKEVNNG